MKVSIIIPNYNGFRLLQKNLPEVINYCRQYEIMFVDDASSDDSVIYVTNTYPFIKVIKRVRNGGFVKAINEGVQAASGDLVYLLNTDVYPRQDFIEHLLPYFKKKDTFAVGSLQESLEYKKVILRGRGVGNFHNGFLIHNLGEVNKNSTLWVSAGAGLFRKDIWNEIGGLNPIYSPFYWEDIDISYRALKAGYKIYFESTSRVVHEQKNSSIRTKYDQDSIATISYRNQILFVWINISDVGFLVQHFLYLFFFLVQSLFFSRLAYVKGFIKALCALEVAYKSRKHVTHISKIADRQILEGIDT